MKTYIYPAVLYLDEKEQVYTIAFHDLQLFTEGESVEESYLRAKEYLGIYSECVLEHGDSMPDATKYKEATKKYKNHIVLLVDARVDENK